MTEPTPLEKTWAEYGSFREAVRVAAAWEPDDLARLTIAHVQEFPETTSSLSDLGPQPEQVLAVVHYLSGVLYLYTDIDDLFADLHRLAATEDGIDAARVEQMTAAIRHLLPASPEAARLLIRQAWEHSGGPYLTVVQGVVDFRAIKEVYSGDIKFVPVGQLRVVIEEQEHGRSDAVIFQVSPSDLETLSAEIQRMAVLMREAEDVLGDSIF